MAPSSNNKKLKRKKKMGLLVVILVCLVLVVVSLVCYFCAKGEVEGDKLEKVDLNYPSCGKTTVNRGILKNKGIVGGDEASPHEFPWLVALMDKWDNRVFCGGTIINERFILTAAHCFYNQDERVRYPGNVLIGVAKHLLKNDGDEKIHHVKKITIHKKFKANDSYYNDIAMIELDQSLRSMIADENGWVRPICLPEKTSHSDRYDDRSAVVAGWGKIGGGKQHSSVMYVGIQIRENGECHQLYKKSIYNIIRQMLCAGTPDGSKDSCNGDSGGPLAVVSDDGTFTLVGVVSFGESCANKDFPGVYTRVTEFLDWIRDNSQL